MEEETAKPKRVKRYDMIRPLGKGGMGKVYLAMDRIIRRPVAVKLFSLKRMVNPGSPKEKVLRDFFFETQTAGALLHPNIVVIYDVGKTGEILYIVMEFVYGKTLLQHQRSGGVSIQKSLEIAYELALALDYAHSKGVVHRDIKPENIIISTQGVPKITDFGIARFRKHLKKQRHALVGSSRFMSPEQVMGREQDHRVDVYQMGVVLYELLTKQAPFKGQDVHETLTKICTETPVPAGRINPEVTEVIDHIVERCLEKDPDKRFSTAGELAERLGECLKSGVHRGLTFDRDLVDRLKKFQLFAQFTEEELDEMAKAGEFVTCGAGEYVLRENSADSDFFVLLEGNVKVVKGARVLSNFLPGSCFGEIGAFARRRRSASVVAVEDCTLLRINTLLFNQLDPVLQLKMLQIVVRDLANLVISLDTEIMQLTAGAVPREGMVTVCPLCGFDNQAPIEVCPRCSVIPYGYEASPRSAPETLTNEENSSTEEITSTDLTDWAI